jgi:hypothetical protein
MGATHKQQFSAFTGIADIRVDAGKTSATTRIVGAADVYVSDFGSITFIPHAYGLTRDCLIIDPEMWAVATLDGMQDRGAGQDRRRRPVRHRVRGGPGLPQREVLDGHRRPDLIDLGAVLRGPPRFPGGHPCPDSEHRPGGGREGPRHRQGRAEAATAPDAEKVAKAQAQKERAEASSA